MLDLEFENFLLKANGNQFQDLFHRLMRQYSNDFMPVVPNGPKGDKGCDGYLSNQGTYFQLYGPINPSKKTTINTAKKKLLEDFNKLNSFIEENESFPRINEYIFVVNNKSESYITMGLAEQLEILKSNVPNVAFSIYDVENIKGIFRGLTLNSQMVVLGKMNNDKSQKAKKLLDQLRTEDIERDVLNLREILQKSEHPIKLIKKTDFISPFESDIMSEIEFFLEVCSKFDFKDKQLELEKQNCISQINNLVWFIIRYSTPTSNPDFLRLKRIGPGEELEGSYSDFDKISNEMFQLRTMAVKSIEQLKKNETRLIQFLESV